MSRVSDIFIRVRDKVGDQDGERWDNERLIRVFNDCLDDISIHTKMFRGSRIIPLYQGKSTYDLPEDLIKLKRTLWEDRTLTLVTSDYMDEKVDLSWRLRNTEKELRYAIYDEQDALKLRLWPRPISDTLTESYDFDDSADGVTDVIFEFESPEVFGVIGTLVDSESVDDTFDLYGVIADIDETQAITVIYDRHAKHIVDVDSVLELPRVYDKAIPHFIASMLLRADTNERNRAYSEEELNLYARDLAEISGLSSKNVVSDRVHNTMYRGMG